MAKASKKKTSNSSNGNTTNKNANNTNSSMKSSSSNIGHEEEPPPSTSSSTTTENKASTSSVINADGKKNGVNHSVSSKAVKGTVTATSAATNNNHNVDYENLDTLDWLRYCYGEQPTTTAAVPPVTTSTTTASSTSTATSSTTTTTKGGVSSSNTNNDHTNFMNGTNSSSNASNSASSSSASSVSPSSLLLEYQPDDHLLQVLQQFLEHSMATKQVVELVYQIWQQTVLSTLLSSCKLWRQTHAVITTHDQRLLKQRFKWARYKIHFILHHVVGGMLTSSLEKWQNRRWDILQFIIWQSLALLPRLVESIPHHKTNVRQVLIHLDGKEFLSAVACETWDTLYEYGIPEALRPGFLIPVLRRCAMLDILDKDWNMLGGWEDVLRGLEAKCGSHPTSGNSHYTTTTTSMPTTVPRLPCDAVLHAQTTILRNARNSMQCKFFSVRFLRYTDDQAPQRWRYFPKCSAPACAHLEYPGRPHPYRCRNCWYFHYCSAACRDYCDEFLQLHGQFCHDTPPTKAAQCQYETEAYLLGIPLQQAQQHQQQQQQQQQAGFTIKKTKSNSPQQENQDDYGKNNNSGNEDESIVNIICNACGATEDWMLPATIPSLPSSSSSLSCSTSSNNSKGCDAEDSNNNTVPGSGMKRCSQCQKVYYCSRQCQEWDWRHGGHKQMCFKPASSTGTATSFHAADTSPSSSNDNETCHSNENNDNSKTTASVVLPVVSEEDDGGGDYEADSDKKNKKKSKRAS
ncbi:hypothetical protein ACA910_017342 [Epithemia clementina (nom. ined.)]